MIYPKPGVHAWPISITRLNYISAPDDYYHSSLTL